MTLATRTTDGPIKLFVLINHAIFILSGLFFRVIILKVLIPTKPVVSVGSWIASVHASFPLLSFDDKHYNYQSDCVEPNFKLKTLLEHDDENLEYNYFLRFDFNSPVDNSRMYAKWVYVFFFLLLAYYVFIPTSYRRLRKRNIFVLNTIDDTIHAE